MRTLVCEFIGFQGLAAYKSGTPNKHYHYLYSGDRNVRAGDWALVHNGNEFGMTKIVRVRPGLDDKVTKNVLAVITQDDFLAYQEANRAINDQRDIIDQLDQMLNEDKKLDKYRELAERNPKAQELLRKAKFWQGPILDAIADKPFSMGTNSGDVASPEVSQPDVKVYDEVDTNVSYTDSHSDQY